ncbi:MAG: DUF3795 domain-containing protein [Dehalococcoidales bacterium]
MISYCGLVCSDCGAYLSTKNNDNNLRKKQAEEWSKQFGNTINPEEINCYGCTSKGKLNFSYCSICEIRKCGQEKKVKNCAYCADYTCEKLDKFFTMVPAARATLEEIRISR